ncbi:Small-subunit processome Utp12 domain-containing protein [Entamoeba marina]
MSQTLSIVDKNSNRYIRVTRDKHVLVYYMDTKKQLCDCWEQSDVVSEPTCIAMTTLSSLPTQKGQNIDNMIVAVGDSNGLVTLWDVVKSNKINQFNVNAAVTALCFNKQQLFIGTNTQTINVVDLTNNSTTSFQCDKNGVTALQTTSNKLITGSVDIRVYSLETLQRQLKQTIHLENIRGIVPLNEDHYLTYSSEQHIFYVILLQLLNYYVDAMFINKTTLLAVALLPTGVINVFYHKLQQNDSTPVTPGCRITAQNTIDLVVYTDRVLLVREKQEQPIFQFVKILQKGALVKDTVIPDIKQQSKESKMMEVVGNEDLGVADTDTIDAIGTVESDKATFEQRMKAMGDLDTGSNNDIKLTGEGIISSLTRALDAKDQILLSRCLSVDDSNIIKNTISNLPASYVVLLLEIACDAFHNNPKKVYVITLWIKAILEYHLSYLMTVPSVSKTIGRLYTSIENRTMSYKHLLRLNGRMNLLFAQITNRQKEQDLRVAGHYMEEDSADVENEMMEEDVESSEDINDSNSESDDINVGMQLLEQVNEEEDLPEMSEENTD